MDRAERRASDAGILIACKLGMKQIHKSTLTLASTFTLAALLAAGCSSVPFQGGVSGNQMASQGPTILNARTEPGVIHMTKNLEPVGPYQVLADVKDFTGNVTNVTLKFSNVPLQVPMQKIAGSTWGATLTPQQLRMLSVAGETARYQANIIATDSNGQSAMNSSPLTVAVATPQIGNVTG